MGSEGHGVHVDPVRLEIGQVLVEGLPVPLEIARLDEGRVRLHQRRGRRVDRCRRVPAVAGDERRDALGDEVLEEVRLVFERQDEVAVRVDVDEAGGDDLPGHVDDPVGLGAVELPDCRDLAILHGHVGLEPRTSGSVDDAPAPQEKVVPHSRDVFYHTAFARVHWKEPADGEGHVRHLPGVPVS